MVNIGRPSGGCATCKRRKIKCDETTPFCMRCQISGRECPGFQRADPVKFFDETAKAKKRAKQRSKGIQSDSNAVLQHNSTDDSLAISFEAARLALGPLQGLLSKVTPEEASTAFFFQHYLPATRSVGPGGMYLASLQNVYDQSSPLSSLRYATEAVALAVISRFPDKAYLRPLRTAKYSQALRLLAYSVGDAEEARSDTTIMCAMVCVLYETFVNTDLRGDVYRKHNIGMTKLLKNRGESQFCNPVSLGIYRSVRGQMVTRGLQCCEGMEEFWFRDEHLMLNDAILYPGVEAWRLGAHGTRLRERSKHLLTSSFDADFDSPACILLSDTYELDQRIVSSWSEQRRRLTGPFTVNLSQDSDSATVWNRRLDIYEDLRHAGFSNQFRVVRIFLQTAVIRCLARMADSEEQLHQDLRYWEACQLLQTLVDDICACIPTYVAKNVGIEATDNTVDEEARAKLVRQGLGAYYMMFPLFVSSSLSILSEEQRQWLKGRLRALANLHGIELAGCLAERNSCIIWGDDGKQAWFANDSGRNPPIIASATSGAWESSVPTVDCSSNAYPYNWQSFYEPAPTEVDMPQSTLA